jgi:hypothetical protein
MGRFLGISVLLLLLFSATALADVVITSGLKDSYAIGDSISIEGFVVASKDISGSLNLVLDCGNKENIESVTVTMKELDKKSFSELGLKNFTVKGAGSCKVRIELVDASAVIESAETKQFEVAKTAPLAVRITLETKSLHLGENLNIKGIAFRLDGSDVNGKADISIEGNNNTYNIGSADIKGGQFALSQPIKGLPGGDYKVQIKVTDSLGNENSFESLSDLGIDDKIDFTFVTNKMEFPPGDNVFVSGNIMTAIKNAKVTASIFGSKASKDVKTSNFLINLTLPNDIPAGAQALSVYLEDDFGNKGSANQELSIKQQARSIDITTLKSALQPGDILSVRLYLYDQTKRDMDGDIELRFSKDSKIMDSKSVKSKEKADFQLDKLAAPGEYSLDASNGQVTGKLTVTVFEVKQVDPSLDGQIVTVENLGNVQYIDPVEFTLTSKSEVYESSIKTSLMPGQKDTVDLGYSFPSGNYDLVLYYGDKSKIYQNVKIQDKRDFLTKTGSALVGVTGNTVFEGAGNVIFDLPLYLFIITLGVAIFMFFKKPRTKDDVINEIKHVEDNPELAQKPETKTEETANLNKPN